MKCPKKVLVNEADAVYIWQYYEDECELEGAREDEMS